MGGTETNWKHFWPGLLNQYAQVLTMSAICLNDAARARTQQVALSLLFTVLDVSRGVQTPALRVWLILLLWGQSQSLDLVPNRNCKEPWTSLQNQHFKTSEGLSLEQFKECLHFHWAGKEKWECKNPGASETWLGVMLGIRTGHPFCCRLADRDPVQNVSPVDLSSSRPDVIHVSVRADRLLSGCFLSLFIVLEV